MTLTLNTTHTTTGESWADCAKYAERSINSWAALDCINGDMEELSAVLARLPENSAEYARLRGIFHRLHRAGCKMSAILNESSY